MNKHSGNVLFLILIAVGLFAALSYAITSSSRGTTANINNEKNTISQSVMDSYTSAISIGLTRLQMRGCSQIDYTPPSGWVNGTKDCFLFHPQGGGVVYQNLGIGSGCPLADLTLGQNCNGLAYAGMSGGNRIYVTTDYGPSLAWNNGGNSFVDIGAISTSDGLANTNLMLSLSNADSPYNAAAYCRTLGAKWYLPANDELKIVRNNKSLIGGINIYETYWASTENSLADAMIVYFNSSLAVATHPKNNTHPVKCTRRD